MLQRVSFNHLQTLFRLCRSSISPVSTSPQGRPSGSVPGVAAYAVLHVDRRKRRRGTGGSEQSRLHRENEYIEQGSARDLVVATSYDCNRNSSKAGYRVGIERIQPAPIHDTCSHSNSSFVTESRSLALFGYPLPLTPCHYRLPGSPMGLSFCIAPARARTDSSPNCLPTICKPTGNPFESKPTGTDATGRPVRLRTNVGAIQSM
jgi:hypothetical protein